MTSLTIVRLGNPLLRQIASPVSFTELKNPDSDTQKFIDEMITVMREEGGVGLAAPQVSRSIRIVVLEARGNERYPERGDIPLMVLVNPSITRYGEEEVGGWESCLSLIDFSGWVPRSSEVTVDALDREGNSITIEASGFLAVVLQHEIDHLNGLLFIDRMPDMKKLAYQEEFRKYWIDDTEEIIEV
tara:strand:- start:213 stop:773 length:561 start_codon:yes stop_codon:yes gene_type:complete